jgi:hypothetical protein
MWEEVWGSAGFAGLILSLKSRSFDLDHRSQADAQLIEQTFFSRTLLFHAPEGTQPKPRKHQGETDCNQHAAGTRFSRMVPHVLTNQDQGSESGQCQECETGDFEPELVHYLSSVSYSRAGTTSEGSPCAGAANLLDSNPGSNA